MRSSHEDECRGGTLGNTPAGVTSSEALLYTGLKAVNPFTREDVPIWIANFVLAEYGAGTIMAVPGAASRGSGLKSSDP